MKNGNAPTRSWFIRLALVAAAVASVPFLYVRLDAAVRPSWSAWAQQQSPGGLAWSPQTLSAGGQASLLASIQSGNLADLRWPNFSDYTAHVQKFYGLYGNALPWVRGMQPTSQAMQMIALIQESDKKGLTPEDYDASKWAARVAKLKPGAGNPSEADAIAFDEAMTVCTMRYISDLHIGKVNPKHFDYGFNVSLKKYDLPEFLKQNVVDRQDVSASLKQIEPPYPGYQRTLVALQNYIQLAKQDDGEKLPEVRGTVQPGDPWIGVPRLTKILQLVGDLPADAKVPANSIDYKGPLVDAVKKFQTRHALPADGKITAQTVADLNVPMSARVQQMQLTLERWRWLPLIDPTKTLPPPLVANVPEFRVRAYDEKFNVVWTMNVVVGHAYSHDTPVFADMMEYVIFRPYWSVPYSIARNEMFSKIEKDPNYLASKGFAVVDAKQDVVTAGAVTPEVLAQLKSGSLFIRQNPGPKNSLGLVKFIFPNDYNVYMHDTDEKQFFSRDRRDDSHGCIRLERPADMALWVLRNNPGWDAAKIKATMNGSQDNLQVNLTQPIPVLIVYATVVVNEDGSVHFFDDIYGHDKALAEVLAKGYPYPG
jgi:murein L,D-transpeptidase YcbB/YkuD